MFFATKGVYPKACVDIVNIFCHSKRHAACIHRRVCSLMTEYNLYCRRTRRFFENRVQDWLEVQGQASFLKSLRFNHAVNIAIQRVGKETPICGFPS